MNPDRGAVRIAVGGGKGGVGKSLLAANLAVATAELGFRTVLVDCDLGAANQHTLFGIDRPGTTLQSFLDREVASVEEIAIPTGAPRLFLIPGVGAVPGAANLAHAQKLKVLRHLAKVDADVVVLDVGAGVSFNVLDFFDAGDLRVVVTSPQLTALQNAYCFLKAAVHRGIGRNLENVAQRDAFKALTSHAETDRLRDLRQRAIETDAGLEGVFARVTRGFGGHLVGNMLDGPRQRKVLEALSRMAGDFLDLAVPVSATLPLDRALHESVTRRRPFLLSHPHHEASRAVRGLAETLLTADVEAIRAARTTAPAPAASGQESDEELLGASIIDYLRREERVEVSHAARVMDGAHAHRVRVRDMSPRGMMIEGPLGAEIGDPLEVVLVGMEDRPTLRGKVRHVSVCGRFAGVEIDTECRSAADAILTSVGRHTSTLPPVRAVAAAR